MNRSVPKASEQKKMIEMVFVQPMTDQCFMISLAWWNKLMTSLTENLTFSHPINNLDLM
jgi:hypothetical protein